MMRRITFREANRGRNRPTEPEVAPGIHPNEAGYVRITEAFLKVVP
jgi:lysophospholipase L1-like esterase